MPTAKDFYELLLRNYERTEAILVGLRDEIAHQSRQIQELSELLVVKAQQNQTDVTSPAHESSQNDHAHIHQEAREPPGSRSPGPHRNHTIATFFRPDSARPVVPESSEDGENSRKEEVEEELQADEDPEHCSDNANTDYQAAVEDDTTSLDYTTTDNSDHVTYIPPKPPAQNPTRHQPSANRRAPARRDLSAARATFENARSE